MAFKTTAIINGYGLLSLLFFIPVLTARMELTGLVHDDLQYTFRLGAVSPFGRIPDSAFPGSQIPVDSNVHAVSGTDSPYLKLQIFQRSSGDNSSAETVTRLSTLPPGVLVDYIGPGQVRADQAYAFGVDPDLFLVVENPELLKNEEEVEFWVVLISRNQSDKDQAVSNPFPFVISVDHQEEEKEGTALYVGIVVLAICLLVLLIPITVRTKRRMRQGKPLCACGSHDQRLRDEEEAKKQESQVKDDVAVIYGATPGYNKPRQSFQSHDLRSVSEPHFQPRWLDPHYKHVHEHPRYHARGSQSASSAEDAASQHSAAVHATGSPSVSFHPSGRPRFTEKM